MLGVPYHWGGRCGWGLDCSGMTSLGRRIDGQSRCHGMLQNNSNAEKKWPWTKCVKMMLPFLPMPEGKITHVGHVRWEMDRVIHASGEVRIDHLVGTLLATARRPRGLASFGGHQAVVLILSEDGHSVEKRASLPCHVAKEGRDLVAFFSVPLTQGIHDVDEFLDAPAVGPQPKGPWGN